MQSKISHKKRLYLSTVVLSLLLQTTSCKKFVEINPPDDKITSSAVFSSEQTAESAVAGLYSNAMQNSKTMYNGGMSLYACESADDIMPNTPSAIDLAFFNNSLTSDMFTISSFWAMSYNSIYQANSILEGLEKSKNISITTKNQLKGEMEFFRAFAYFYLTNLFGDVPLELTSDYSENAVKSRTNSSQVYQQVIKDLQDAQTLLSVPYLSTDRIRPNKFTAAALLARVYLYQKKWSDAETESSLVLNSGIYNLEQDLKNVFLIASNETIWQLADVNTLLNTTEGKTFIPSSSTAKPPYSITALLLNSFEAGDSRKSNWISSNLVVGQTYYYPSKYKSRKASPFTEYNIVFRLAEQYLIRAESRAQQGKIIGLNSAESDINTIRYRSNLLNTVAATQADMLLAIEQERRVEFFAEWGHRWLDLKRTDRSDPILGSLKGSNWQSSDVLYPLPLGDLKVNSSLVQNKGY